MTSNGSVTIPVAHQETQPLLGSQPQQPIQQPFRCRRGPLCRRCLAGSHEDTRKRKYMRRTAFAMICIWLWYLTFGFSFFGFNKRRHRGPLAPWEGRRLFEFEEAFTTSMSVNIGKGNIVGDVDIQISSKVNRPTLLLDAKVNKDEDVLHVETAEGNGIFRFHVWSDKQSHGNHNKASAEIHIRILFPATMTSFGTLSVKGTVSDIRAGDLGTILFESIDLSSVVGTIDMENLLVSRLNAFVTDGSITMANVEGPVSKRLDMNLQTNVGPIKAVAIVHRLVKGIDLHNIVIRSKTGSIVLDVLQADPAEERGPLPGNLLITASSEVGDVETNVSVLDGQHLGLSLSGATSLLEATVSDNYLGKIYLASNFGPLGITEWPQSRSVIKYEESSRKKKVAHKFIRNGRRAETNGSINMNSDVGKVNLKFVKPEY